MNKAQKYTSTLIEKLRYRADIEGERALEIILEFLLWRYISDAVMHPIDKRFHDPGIQYHFKQFSNNPTLDFFKKSMLKWVSTNKFLEDVFKAERWNIKDDLAFLIYSYVTEMSNLFVGPGVWNSHIVGKLFDEATGFLYRDRRYMFEFFTPNDVSELISALVVTDRPQMTIYDPSSGSGDLLNTVYSKVPHATQLIGREKNLFMQKILRIRMLMLSVDFDIQSPGDLWSESRFDIVITNPPFGVKMETQKVENKWYTPFLSNKSEQNILVQMLDSLSVNGIGVIILPNGFLFQQGKTKRLRQEIIERDILELIIHLPAKVFFNTGVSASLLLFNKKKTQSGVLMIDASRMGGKTNDKVELSREDITTILEKFQNNRTTPMPTKDKGVQKVSLDRLRENGFDLQFSTYQKLTADQSFRPSEEVWADCIELERLLVQIQNKTKALMK